MRKIVTFSMAASAALLVAACGQSETTNTADANAMVTEMNAGDAMEGTVNDTMTNVDGAMGATDNGMMMNDSDAMGSMNSSNAMMADNATNAM